MRAQRHFLQLSNHSLRTGWAPPPPRAACPPCWLLRRRRRCRAAPPGALAVPGRPPACAAALWGRPSGQARAIRPWARPTCGSWPSLRRCRCARRARAGAQWEKAAEVFEQMQRQGCRPDVVSYTALIQAYERGGQWRRALAVSMPAPPARRRRCCASSRRQAGAAPLLPPGAVPTHFPPPARYPTTHTHTPASRRRLRR